MTRVLMITWKHFFFFVFLMRTIRERNNARGRIYILLKYGCFRAA